VSDIETIRDAVYRTRVEREIEPALAALERLSARLEELEGKLDEASALPDMWMDGRDGARAQFPYEDWMPRYWTALGLWDCAAALCRALEMPEPDPLPEPTTPTPGPYPEGEAKDGHAATDGVRPMSEPEER
jgi:hypothetical protein